MLRSYVKIFNREVLEVDEAEDKVQLTTLKARLKLKDFVITLSKSPPELMAKMLLKAQKYMNAEDALAAIGQGDEQKERRSTQDKQKGRKRERSSPSSSRDSIKRKDNKSPRTVKFIPLVMPVDKILMQIKDDNALKGPKALHFSPNVRDKKKYCHFHKDCV